jgi:aromatic ring hydroxylase
MSAISIAKLYDLLSLKVGRETAEELTSFIEEKVKEETDNKTRGLTTKEDLANATTGTIKWMFVFWVGQMAATFGFILLFLKK